MSTIAGDINEHGFCLLRHALDEHAVRIIRGRCADLLSVSNGGDNARSSRGHVYAARNLIGTVPEVLTVWRGGLINQTLRQVLGQNFGLVRALFFDKPPDRSWSLPWHKDTTIAVADNSLPSTHFSRPTFKAGVPHVIASDDCLRRMLTIRIHLDDVTDENGPLRVIPQSHGSKGAVGLGLDAAVAIHASAGDCLAMRPLIDHASGSSLPGTTRHRRILHLEFAADQSLPDGFRWFHFVSNAADPRSLGTSPVS
jgi:hypothetical protein